MARNQPSPTQQGSAEALPSTACSPFDVGAAIATIEDSRRTHADWCQWFEKNPEEEAKHAKTVHSAAEQREIIAGYDNVLACLRHLEANDQIHSPQ